MDHGSIDREAKWIGRKAVHAAKVWGERNWAGSHALSKLHSLLLLSMAAYWSSWTTALAIQDISFVLIMEDAFGITMPLA